MPFDNLVVNGGFEAGPFAPWLYTGAFVTSVFSHTGFLSAQLYGETSTSFITQDIPVTPGQRYEIIASQARIGRSNPSSGFLSLILTQHKISWEPG
jgi:hypothetical protein